METAECPILDFLGLIAVLLFWLAFAWLLMRK